MGLFPIEAPLAWYVCVSVKPTISSTISRLEFFNLLKPDVRNTLDSSNLPFNIVWLNWTHSALNQFFFSKISRSKTDILLFEKRKKYNHYNDKPRGYHWILLKIVFFKQRLDNVSSVLVLVRFCGFYFSIEQYDPNLIWTSYHSFSPRVVYRKCVYKICINDVNVILQTDCVCF